MIVLTFYLQNHIPENNAASLTVTPQMLWTPQGFTAKGDLVRASIGREGIPGYTGHQPNLDNPSLNR